MSRYIPFDIQEKIIKSLPVRSLIQFRSVSKQWKFFIDSSEFIDDYHVRYTEPHYLTLSNKKPIIVNPRILRSSRGLFGSCRDIDNKEIGVLWNPLIRKSVAIDVPSVVSFWETSRRGYTVHDKTVVGFGICRHTNDPKIVSITNYPFGIRESTISPRSSRLWNVRAYTLRSGTWKRQFFSHNLDESIYWLAFDGRTKNNVELFEWYDLIMSIDMTREEFTQENVHPSLSNTKLPFIRKSLATQAAAEVDLFISSVRKHLTNVEAKKISFWIPDESVPKSFIERFEIWKPHGCIQKVYGQRKQYALFVYKPHSNDINSITIFGKRYSFFACREQDQLFLLDQ